MTQSNTSHTSKKWLYYVAMIGILIIGWTARLTPLNHWQQQKDVFFYQQQPLLINNDGYFYLRLAQDLVNNSYEEVDSLRTYPNHPNRPTPAPLLSSITAWLHQVTNQPIEWMACLLPTFLASLIIFPLAGVIHYCGGGTFMKLSAALFCCLSLKYAERTSFGFFDTDCMNVVFTVTAVYCAMGFAFNKALKRYLYLFGWVSVFGLFLLWWDQVSEVVSLICLFPLLIALIFDYRPNKKEFLLFSFILLCGAIAISSLKGPNLLTSFIEKTSSTLSFGLKKQTSVFPATSAAIIELKSISLINAAKQTHGHLIVYLASLLGIVLFIFKKPKENLFLIVLFCLSLFPFFLGQRFLIFHAPVGALGLGFLIHELCSERKSYRLARYSALLLLITFSFINVTSLNRALQVQKLPGVTHVIDGIDALSQHTQPHSVIWSTWEVGYPTMHFANRKVISDGEFMQGDRLVHLYFPLVCQDQKLAARFIVFYCAHGLKGMQTLYQATGNDFQQALDLLKTLLTTKPARAHSLISTYRHGGKLIDQPFLDSPSRWHHFFFPKHEKPIYLFLHKDMTVLKQWFYFGSWDTQTQQGKQPLYWPWYQVKETKSHLQNTQGFKINRQHGGSFNRAINGQLTAHPIDYLLTYTGKSVSIKEFNQNQQNIGFEWAKPFRYGAIMDGLMAKSVFNQLFIRHSPDEECFRLIQTNIPDYQIWEVILEK